MIIKRYNHINKIKIDQDVDIETNIQNIARFGKIMFYVKSIT